MNVDQDHRVMFLGSVVGKIFNLIKSINLIGQCFKGYCLCRSFSFYVLDIVNVCNTYCNNKIFVQSTKVFFKFAYEIVNFK